MISSRRAGSSPAFQNVCHWSRGLKIRSPGPPTRTSSPSSAPTFPSSTYEYSSSRVCRCRGAASERGDIGCSTSEKPRPVSSPSIIQRTPIEPRNPAAPSSGPITFAMVLSFHRTLVSREFIHRSGRCVKIRRTAMTDEKRPYRKRRRAELEAETRLRITESAVELHGTLGPARTSMSAVAEHAGVRRSTLYRHFPDERALFGACSAHWAEANPPPDISGWSSIKDPGERLDVALAELYAFYGRNEEMLDRLLRDAPTVPVVNELMGAFRAFFDEAAK